MEKIDLFAHILPPRYMKAVERLLTSPDASERVAGYRSWFFEDTSFWEPRRAPTRPRAVRRLQAGADAFGAAGRGAWGASVTVPLAEEANDELAELCDPTTVLPGSPSVSPSTTSRRRWPSPRHSRRVGQSGLFRLSVALNSSPEARWWGCFTKAVEAERKQERAASSIMTKGWQHVRDETRRGFSICTAASDGICTFKTC